MRTFVERRVSGMRTEARNAVVGVFGDASRARDAIAALKDAGFHGDDIGLLMPDGRELPAGTTDTENEAGAGAATGAVTGSVLGGLGGFLVGMGALAIPVFSPFIAAGAFTTALAGIAAGAAVGAIAGALVGIGILKEEAEWYERELRGGRTLVTVHADGRYDEAQTLLGRYGAYDVETQDVATVGAASRSAIATTSHPDFRMGRWEEVGPAFRRSWQERFAAPGMRWEQHEILYRYGWEQALNPRYKRRSWTEIEPQLRRDWESHYPDRPWDQAAYAIRDAWGRVRSTVPHR
jgi:hypothetical protein